jgi:hypothetical protein
MSGETTDLHTPLDPSTLSPAAQKALGSPPGRMMAARGMAPLPPADQMSVLYQLAIDGDSSLASAARSTILGMPDKLVASALGETSLDPRVLDLFAHLLGDRPSVFDTLVGNNAVADATIAMLAVRAGPREIDRIAANEQRLLRHPEIISAMYMNKSARMSTVDRAVELAVRNNVRVPGLACWDEIAKALQTEKPQTSAEVDALFDIAADAAREDDSLLTKGDGEKVRDDSEEDKFEKAIADKTKNVPINELSVPAKIRLATLGNAFQRGALIRDPLRVVYMATIKSPAVTEFEAQNYAGNPNLPDDVLRFVASKREWTKLYGTKYALCKNPKTPITEAMRLMPFLREKDLVILTKSKGVASAVVAQARKLMMQRRGGEKK